MSRAQHTAARTHRRQCFETDFMVIVAARHTREAALKICAQFEQQVFDQRCTRWPRPRGIAVARDAPENEVALLRAGARKSRGAGDDLVRLPSLHHAPAGDRAALVAVLFDRALRTRLRHEWPPFVE